MHSDKLSALLNNGSLWCAENLSEEEEKKLLERVFGDTRDLSLRQRAPSCSSAAAPVVPFHIDAIDRALPAGGLRTGAIHEWFTEDPHGNTIFSAHRYPPATLTSMLAGNLIGALSGKTSEKVRFDKFLLWIGEWCWPAPFLLQNILSQYSSEQSLLAKCLFLNPQGEKALLESVDAALRSPAVAVVVADLPRLSFPVSRRFALSCAKNNTLGLFVRNIREVTFSTAAETKWKISPYPSPEPLVSWRIHLLKSKGHQAEQKRWIVTLDDSTEQWQLEEPCRDLQRSSTNSSIAQVRSGARG
jgi:protein ImuA